ncbi:hypothetical protein FRC06_006618 [Ceratobasidium sp. 370]|nr:hypothetical protein FRC06_006618 [Ceratobasidium sp. 370]
MAKRNSCSPNAVVWFRFETGRTQLYPYREPTYDGTSNHYVSDYACSDAASSLGSWIDVGTPPTTPPPRQPPSSSARKSQDMLSGSKNTIINIISTNSASAN